MAAKISNQSPFSVSIAPLRLNRFAKVLLEMHRFPGIACKEVVVPSPSPVPCVVDSWRPLRWLPFLGQFTFLAEATRASSSGIRSAFADLSRYSFEAWTSPAAASRMP